MTRALIITNPAASRTRHANVELAARTLRAGGWEVRVLATGGSGDARRLAAEGVRDGVDVVGVIGGDGTIMQAAAALVGTQTRLGILPGGTGNLLAGNLRIPTDPRRAAQSLLSAVPRALDLGRVARPDGDHFFAVAAGAGVDAQVMAETRPAAKLRWGMGAYIATALRLLPTIRSRVYQVTVDGVEMELRASVLVVANCAEVIPPLVKFRSGVAPDDGMLDVLALRADTFVESVRSLYEFFVEQDRPIGQGLVAYTRGRSVQVRTEVPIPMQLDGDLAGMTPFSADVMPGAVQVMVPPRSAA